MNGAFEIGAAALRAEQRALETHANNVANINTPGFKRQDNSFSEVVARTGEGTMADNATTGAPSDLTGSGVRLARQQMLFAQGEMRATGNALDLGIDGKGLIELLGPRGETMLWRGGRLRVNDDGMLATDGGIPLAANITVPYDATALRIAADGVVSAETADGEALELGQIGLVSISHASAVERLDGGLLRLLPAARASDMIAGEDGAGLFVQGSIEESNVDLTEEMVQMMIVQRAYAANAQVMQAADQLASITNNLKR